MKKVLAVIFVMVTGSAEAAGKCFVSVNVNGKAVSSGISTRDSTPLRYKQVFTYRQNGKVKATFRVVEFTGSCAGKQVCYGGECRTPKPNGVVTQAVSF